MFDYAIIGAGPTGLTLALLLAEKGYRVTILERLPVIGGCHRVNRTKDGAFSEHGPRIYSNSFKTFEHVLEKITKISGLDVRFNQIFTPYQFQVSSILTGSTKTKGFFGHLTLPELASLAQAYLKMFITSDFDVAQHQSIRDFMILNSFSPESQDYIDRFCRLTDGAGAEAYSLYKFLQLANQETLYGIYQPRMANDRRLLLAWTTALQRLGVSIQTDTACTSLVTYNNKVTLINTNKGPVQANTVILACPPKALNLVLKASGLGSSTLDNWVAANSYRNYYCVTFQWKQPILQNTKRIWGFPATPHGVAFIVLSDYFQQNSEPYQTTISCTATKPTGFEHLSNQQILDTIFIELKQSYPSLPDPDVSTFGSGPDDDSAYIQSAQDPRMLDRQILPNLFTVGSHTGGSNYAFTTIETACASAVSFVSGLSESKTHKIPIRAITLNQVLLFLLLILFIVVALSYDYKKGEAQLKNDRTESSA